MDQCNGNDLFSKEGWIVARNIDGRIKVTLDNQNETSVFNRTHYNWITLQNSNVLRDDDSDQKMEEKKLKVPYRDVGSKSVLTGMFLIRDLLNLQKPNNLSNIFLADGLQVGAVSICARITSVDLKTNYYRLVVDDGTSAILCMVKNTPSESERNLQDETDNSLCHTNTENTNASRLLKKLALLHRKLIRDTSPNYDQSSLGIPLMIVGNLQQFYGKNYIFAYNVRRVTEEYFVHFMNYIVQMYEYKVNFMFEYNLLLFNNIICCTLPARRFH